jgi:hypothetical protein
MLRRAVSVLVLLLTATLLLAFSLRANAQEEVPAPEPQVENNNGVPQGGPMLPDPEKAVPTKKYAVTGMVVNTTSGEGLPRALVTMNNQLTTMTDSDGKFEFDGVAAGTYYFNARKPGYFGAEEIAQSATPPGLFEVGPDAKSLTLKLSPEAVVFGRITDSDGLPVPRLGIICSRLTMVEGRKQWQQSQQAATDEDGEYRLAKLTPGTYRIKAGPSMTPALGAMARTARENSGYSAVFFPNAAGNESSQGIRLNAGQKLEVNLAVEAAPFYKITGTFSGTKAPWLQLIPRGGEQEEHGAAGLDASTGTFAFRMVPAGDYTLRARGEDEGKILYASIPLHVVSDIAGLHIPLQPAVTIPVEIRMERTKPENVPPGLTVVGSVMQFAQVRLRSVGDQGQDAMASFEQQVIRQAKNGRIMAQTTMEPPRNYAVRNVLPGTYSVEIQPTSQEFYVASARYGSTDLLRENFVITSSATQEPIDILMRDDGARVKGTLTPEGGTSKQVVVLVIPEQGPASVRMVQMFGEGGEFSLGVLRPGTYWLLAFDDVSDLDYSDADALEPFMSRAAHLDLAPNQETTVKLDLIKREEK